MTGVDYDGLTSVCPVAGRGRATEGSAASFNKGHDDKGTGCCLSGEGEAALTGNTTHNPQSLIKSVT